jgi:Protein of unknown function (DUF3168)
MSAIPITIAALQQIPAVVAATGGRIFPIQAPQGAALPHLTVTVGSEAEGYCLDGADDQPEARVSFVIRASTAKETGDIGAAIIAGLKDRRTPGVWFYREPTDFSDYVEGLKCFRRVIGFNCVYST